jgi:tRNA dimethylallyltransferase
LSQAQPAIVLFGPTAVGKTELLERLILSFPHLEVISADSMQVYRGLDIGTAKPSREVLARIPHHLIDLVEPHIQFSAGEFVRRAERLNRELRSAARLPVLCGGTAYYLRSFICGLPEAPASDPEVRRELKGQLRERGLASLLEELARVDPATRGVVAASDSHRALRALEVYRSTGRPLSSFLNPDRPRPGYRLLLIGLHRERQELYRRIDERVMEMFRRGLPEEVKGLLGRGYGPADPGLRGIGYREFLQMREGCQTLSEVREAVQRNSRRYAKRQITFFKGLPDVRWVPADAPEATDTLVGLIDGFLCSP